MKDMYTSEQRRLQETFGTQTLAAAHKDLIITKDIPADHAAFIASRDFFFLSTVNDRGEPTVSYKGGGVNRDVGRARSRPIGVGGLSRA